MVIISFKKVPIRNNSELFSISYLYCYFNIRYRNVHLTALFFYLMPLSEIPYFKAFPVVSFILLYWHSIRRKARSELFVKALHGLEKADAAELIQIIRLNAAAEKAPRHAPDEAGVFLDHLLRRLYVTRLRAPQQRTRLFGDHARRRMRRHIVTVVPRPGTDLTRSVSMKLSMMVKPMPLRSSPPVVYIGVRACATSAMPTP